AVQASLIVTGDKAPQTLAGSWSLGGNALVQFRAGGITAVGNGAALTLDGKAAHMAVAGKTLTNSALSNLSANAGGLTLSNGASLTHKNGFDNSGGYGVFDGARMSTLGTFVNSGSIDVQGTTKVSIAGLLENSGTLTIDSAYTKSAVTVDSLMNSGAIHLS